MLVKSIPWRRTKRSVARVEGFNRRTCWLEVDQTGRIDSQEVEKGCRVVILTKFISISSREQTNKDIPLDEVIDTS